VNERLELLIIGGGPAGMAAALVAGRARLNTVVVNAERPRNAVSRASHGFLTRDGAHAIELLDIEKMQLKAYKTVRYVAAEVIGVDSDGDGYAVRTAGETWRTRRVVVAAGQRDVLASLNLPGIEAIYGRSAFPCPFCDGFEHADQRIAVFAGESAAHFVPVVRVWSDDVVLFTNGRPLPTEVLEGFSARGVQVETAPVERLVAEGSRLRAVRVAGREIPRDVAFLGEDFSVPTTSFAADLGVPKTRNDWGMEVLDADETGATVVPGVYVIGDARTGFGGIAAAAAEGSGCASHIVHEVAMERWST